MATIASVYVRRTHPRDVPTVLFVCVQNRFRSVIAEAFFNAHARAGWKGISAGISAPRDRVNPLAAELLAEVGIDVSAKRPQTVTAEMVRTAWRVVTFGCLDRCPAEAASKNEDWPVPGFEGRTAAQLSETELREIREEIRRRVLDLVDRLPTV